MEKNMELKELTDKTLELFGVTSPEQLGYTKGRKCRIVKKMPYSITDPLIDVLISEFLRIVQ